MVEHFPKILASEEKNTIIEERFAELKWYIIIIIIIIIRHKAKRELNYVKR